MPFRKAKAERLRAGYRELVYVANALHQQAQAFGLFAALPDARKAIDAALTNTMKNLERTLAALQLETDSDSVLDLFKEIRESFTSYRYHVEEIGRAAERGTEVGSGPPKNTYQGLLDSIATIQSRLPLAGVRFVASLNLAILGPTRAGRILETGWSCARFAS